MKRLLAAAILVCLPVAASAGPVVVQSTGSVPETVKRLKATVEGAGARVFAVVDFSGAVKRTGKDIGELELVTFGDPRFATSADGQPAHVARGE